MLWTKVSTIFFQLKTCEFICLNSEFDADVWNLDLFICDRWHYFISCRRQPCFSCCFVSCCWACPHPRNLILLAPAARKFSLIFLSLVWIRTHCSLYLLVVLFMHKSCDAIVWVSIWCKLDDVTIYKELVSLGEILSLLTLWLNFSAATCWTCIFEHKGHFLCWVGC